MASTCPSCGSKSVLHARASDADAAPIVDDDGDDDLTWGTGDKRGLVLPKGGRWRWPTDEELAARPQLEWGTGEWEGLVSEDGKPWRQPTEDEIATRSQAVESHRVTTLDTLPGHRIVDSLGLVSTIGAMSGWTAKAKGDLAARRSYGELMWQAMALGANAVVGVSASAFGAGGGITSVLGGDAVGVLYVGTAVIVEADNA